MNNNDLEYLFSNKAIIRGGLKFYRYEDAVLLINICKDNNIDILGIDAFFISNGYTHPLSEYSIDLSNIKTNKYESIYEFLESQREAGLVYEIIY